MAIGDFLGKLKGEGKAEPKKFLALVLTDQVVQAAVWSVIGDKTEIVALGTPVEWDGETGTTSELVSAADATISGATEGLTEEPTEMVIGVAHGWTDKNGILGAKRELIKTICKELELKPLGFVVLTDSILRYLKMQEGTPATSILIQVSRDEVVLVLVRLGRIEATEVVGRSDDIVADVEEGMSRFPTGDHLPSRIIIESGIENGEELVQNLVSNDWQGKFTFLHLPKIESLPKDIAIRAVAVAGGAEVAKAIGFSIVEESTAKAPAQAEELVTPAATAEVETEQDEDDEPEEEEVKEPNIISASAAGFTIGGSLTAKDLEIAPVAEVSEPVAPRPKMTIPKLPSMPKISLPSLHMPTFKLPKTPALIILGVIALITIIAFSFIWLLPKATVTLAFATKPLEESVALTLSPTASALDTDASVVPVTKSTETVSGEKSVPTTGKKTIGDPAKGQVTVYNKTSLTKTFTKGTSLAAGSLKFTLDSDVTVASSSSSTEGITFGKNTVNVTASAIGQESNLKSGTELTIASFAKDTYVAKNDAALAGGTSKEIQAVASEDKATLVKELTAELLDKAKSQIEAQNSPSQGYYVTESGATVESETYSDKVGAEATQLTGTLELTVTILRYNKSDVTELVAAALTQKIPSGYTRVGDLPIVELSAGEEDEDGNIATTAKVTIALIPTVDTASLAGSLRGQKSGNVQQVLSSLPGLTKADVEITPLWLPPRLKSMPRKAGNITIVVESN